MTLPGSAAPRATFLDALSVYLKPRVLIVLFLGFSSGLPLALSGGTLLVWLRESGLDLGIIGLFTLAGTPYTVKFLWAPLTDALDAPLLARWLGRRRGWLVFSQLLLIAAILLLGLCDPTRFAWPVVLSARDPGGGGLRHAGHRGRRFPYREPAGKRTGRRHGGLCRGLSHRHAGLDRRRAVSGELLPVLSASARRRPGIGAIRRWQSWC